MRRPPLNGRRSWPTALAASVAAALVAGTIAALAPATAGAAPAARHAERSATRQATGATGAPTGFAAVPGWGQDGTTGGAGGGTVTVSSVDAFLDAIATPEPLVVQAHSPGFVRGHPHAASPNRPSTPSTRTIRSGQ